MNESGIHPVDEKVLVKPLKAERVTSGGIVIPEDTANKHDMAQVKAKVVAVGPRAFEFTYEFAKEHGRDVYFPVVGNTVTIAKYAGYPITGKDKETYRIINDADITAILEESND